MIIVPSDVGYRFTKTLGPKSKVVIPSVLGKVSKPFSELHIPIGNSDKPLCVSVNESPDIYLLGEAAINFTQYSRFSLDRDKFIKDLTPIFALSAIGKLTSGSVKVATGLPISHYEDFKDIIKDELRGIQKLTYHSFYDNEQIEKVTISIQDVEVIMQGFAGIINYVLDDNGQIQRKKEAEQVIGNFDIGFRTVDFCMTNRLVLLPYASESEMFALQDAYRIIADKLKRECQEKLSVHEVDYHIRNNKPVPLKDGTDLRLNDEFKSVITMLGENIVEHANNLWEKERPNTVLVSGGGGKVLFPIIKKHFPRATLMQDSFWANAKGYMKWGVRKWGKQK